MKNFLILTFCLYSAGCWVVSEEIKVTGYEGQKVTIKCSHSNAGSNLKYFCRKNKCTNKDILIKNEVRQRNPTKGRFSLYDDESGTFTVTITGLKKTDTGTYRCGIDRTLMDTYTEVQLTVLDAPQSVPSTVIYSTAPPPGTTAYNQETQSTGPLSTNMNTPLKTTDQLVYIAVGLGATVLLFVFALLLFIRLRHRIQKSQVAGNSSSRLPVVGPDEILQTEYAELKDTTLQSPVCSAVQKCPKREETVTYSTVQCPRMHSDTSGVTVNRNSVIYSNVNF